jgi:peptide/nickel transport system ATP-binding protein
MSTLLEARELRAGYATAGPDVTAVDGVSLVLREREVLGIAGESGCGKSTLASVLALTAQPPLYVTEGSLALDGRSIDVTGGRRVDRELRGKLVSLLPQGAMNSLNPTVRVRDLASDVIRAHEPELSRRDAVDRARERLEQLALPTRVLDSYPHQLSGGMRQRVVAVVSTLLNPSVLIADEPTSALDVSAQRGLVQLLRTLLDRGFIKGIVFITHDLPLLGTVADRVAIMYAGQLAEVGPAEQVLGQARHPYTKALVDTVLVPDPGRRGRRVEGIPGAPPDLRHPPSGCRFHPRCPLAMPVCRSEAPPRVGDPDRFAACWWVHQHQSELRAV